MKILKHLLIVVALLLTISSDGQTLAEWTKQKKTQIKYLLQQVAALHGYISQVQKGYTIVQKGLFTIGSITGGEFRLHQDAFDALRLVDPVLYHYAQLPGMVRTQWQLVRQTSQVLRQIRESQQFNPEEMAYAERVMENVRTSSFDVLSDLVELITNDQFSMNDAARMKRMDQAHQGLKALTLDVQRFYQTNTVLAVQRRRDARDIETTSKLYNLKK